MAVDDVSRRGFLEQIAKAAAGVIVASSGIEALLPSKASAIGNHVSNNHEYPEITEKEILEKGVYEGSERWQQILRGNVSGAGMSKKQWTNYLAQTSQNKEYVLDMFVDSVKEKMRQYPIGIHGLGGGGCWNTSYPNNITLWDDESNLEKVKFRGIDLPYTPKSVTSKEYIMHEYAHGVFDVFGAFADNSARLINKEEFEKDTLRLVNDEKYAKNPFVEYLIKDVWAVKDGKINQALTERFATLGQLFVGEEKLPYYITRHFNGVIKNDAILKHTHD